MYFCEVDWSLWPGWISALSSLGTLCVAIWAARSWRTQLRGGSKYAVAQEVATSVRVLQYAFYGARSPMIEGWEFPASYWHGDVGAARTAIEEAEAYRHVYNNRMRELWPSIKAVADLRARAGAVIGEALAKELEALARKARELDFFYQQRVEQLRSGPAGVALRTNQSHISQIQESVVVNDPPDDGYSEEFETIFHRVLAQLRPLR